MLPRQSAVIVESEDSNKAIEIKQQVMPTIPNIEEAWSNEEGTEEVMIIEESEEEVTDDNEQLYDSMNARTNISQLESRNQAIERDGQETTSEEILIIEEDEEEETQSENVGMEQMAHQDGV